jgi:hypothetical protein
LVPDVVRKLAKSFASERQEVKHQILGLSLKNWAFHSLNAQGKAAELIGKSDDTSSPDKSTQLAFTSEDSAALLPRLEAITDHIINVAAYDLAWDVRDMARALKKLKAEAKAAMAKELAGSAVIDGSLEQLSLAYCNACLGGTQLADASGAAAAGASQTGRMGVGSTTALESSFSLGSMAQALDFPLESYRPIPQWASANSSDDLRKVKVEAPPSQVAPKSICSDNIGNSQHMERRVQNPSNITNVPVASTLEDIDLFYSDPGPVSKPAPAQRAPATSSAGAAPTTTLEQMGLGATAPVGTAVFGEDDESDDEEDSDDGGDDWKYCAQAQQLPQSSQEDPPPATAYPAASSPPPAGPAVTSSATAQAPEVASSTVATDPGAASVLPAPPAVAPATAQAAAPEAVSVTPVAAPAVTEAPAAAPADNLIGDLLQPAVTPPAATAEAPQADSLIGDLL